MNYILTFTEGVLAFISPCILPMLPVYFVYLAGVGGAERDCSSKNRLALNSAGFVLGFTLVFVLMGATVTAVGGFLAGHRGLLRVISGIVMIFFGLHFTDILKVGILNTHKRLEYNFEKLRFPGSILFGVVFGCGWTPCLGAFLGSALALAGNSETIIQGAFLLLLFSLGLGIPFIVTAVIFDSFKAAFGFLNKYGRLISLVSGILLILAGVLVVTDRLKYLSF